MICGSRGSKSRLAKAAGAEPAGQMRDEKLNCTPLWREANFEVNMLKAGPLLEVEMSKKCTPLWREAHFEVKMWKAPGGSDHFWTFRCRFAWQAHGIVDLVESGHVEFCSIFNYNHHYTTLHSNTLRYNYNYTFATFHYTSLRSTQLHSITLSYTTL